MLEWYRAGASLQEIMADFVDLVRHICVALDRPHIAWEGCTVEDLCHRHASVDLRSASARELGGHDEPWDDAFHRCWVEHIEPQLQRPTLVYDWPASQAALARTRRTVGGDVALRCEAYVDGHEVANAFDELTERSVLLERWRQNNAIRRSNNEAPHPIDDALLDATARLPRCAGIAVGFERLIAVLCGWDNLHRGQVQR